MLAALLALLILVFLAGALTGYGLRAHVSRQRRLKKRKSDFFQDCPESELDAWAKPVANSDALHNLQA